MERVHCAPNVKDARLRHLINASSSIIFGGQLPEWQPKHPAVKIGARKTKRLNIHFSIYCAETLHTASKNHIDQKDGVNAV